MASPQPTTTTTTATTTTTTIPSAPHLSTLTSIERDIASLLSLAGSTIQNPTRPGIAEFHRSLASISARLQRQVVALRAADIVVGLEPKGGDRVGREMERELWSVVREMVEGGKEGVGEERAAGGDGERAGDGGDVVMQEVGDAGGLGEAGEEEGGMEVDLVGGMR